MATTTTRKAATKPAADTATKPTASGTRKPAAAKANGTPAAEPKVADVDAPVPAGIQAINDNQERAAKAKATRETATASGATQICVGPCAKTKPITKFPTTSANKDGVMGRGKVCRECRDAHRKTK